MDNTEYKKFVSDLTSDYSSDFDTYIGALTRLHGDGCDIQRLDTALTGLASESGEVLDILKKMKFQGKTYESAKSKIIDELGDVMFYFFNALMALDIEFDEVLKVNMDKLNKRYKDRKFSIDHSENR